jgi:hypothetical protein
MADINTTKVLDLCMASGALTKKLGDRLAKQAELESQVEAQLPTTVDALLAHKRVTGDRDKIASALRDPVKALKLLAKVAAHISEDEQAVIGSLEKPAAATRPAAQGYLTVQGGRPDDGLRDSDRALLAHLAPHAVSGND